MATTKQKKKEYSKAQKDAWSRGGKATATKNRKDNSNRGLASALPETRKEVAIMGGKAKHNVRGLQAASPETRLRVASAGGKASRRGPVTEKKIIRRKKNNK